MHAKIILTLIVSIGLCMFSLTMENEHFIQKARILTIQTIASDTNNNVSVTIPFVTSTLDPASSSALCYNSLKSEKLIPFSLVMCRHLGFTSLQRIYAINASNLNSHPQVGVELDILCAGYELQLNQCHLKSQHELICHNFLGIHCSECNQSIQMQVGERYSIEFPSYMPCAPHTFCEWNIVMKTSSNKNIILELKSHATDPTPVKENAFKGRRLEVQWFDSQIEKWVLHKDNENNLEKLGTIKVSSDKMILRYFVLDCCFTSIKKQLQAIIYSEPLKTEAPADYQKGNLFFVILPASVLLLGTVTVMLCLCCDTKRKQRLNIHSPNISRDEQPENSEIYINEENCLMVAFRGFLHSSRNATLNNSESNFISERLHLNLDAVDNYLSDRSNPVTLQEGNEGDRPNFERGTSYEVGSKHPFMPSQSVLDDTCEPLLRAEPPLLKQNSNSSTDVWGSPCSEEEMIFSCKSSDSGLSYFSVRQNQRAPGNCSEVDTLTSISFECPSPVMDKFSGNEDPKPNISTML